jgi:phage recombination protein Bet
MTTTELAPRPTSPGIAALPATAEPRSWTPQQRALMEFAGLARWVVKPGNVKELELVNPAVAEAFLVVCKRTGLDPFAKQIYAMDVGGRLSIVVGIDGFRIVAQRSKGYAGQIGPQWATGRKVSAPMLDAHGRPMFKPDGDVIMFEQDEWVDAWLPEQHGLEKGAKPLAARLGVLRAGFDQPLWQVVTWAEFGVEPRFNGDNWGIRPAHMLGIRAETHGLRRTFPNDLSGLYTPEDFDDVRDENAAEVKVLVAEIEKITDLAELTRRYHELNAQGMADSVRAALMARAGQLGAQPTGSTPGGEDATPPSKPSGDASAPDHAAEGGKTARGGARDASDDVPHDPSTADPTDYDDAEVRGGRPYSQTQQDEIAAAEQRRRDDEALAEARQVTRRDTPNEP